MLPRMAFRVRKSRDGPSALRRPAVPDLEPLHLGNILARPSEKADVPGSTTVDVEAAMVVVTVVVAVATAAVMTLTVTVAEVVVTTALVTTIVVVNVVTARTVAMIATTAMTEAAMLAVPVPVPVPVLAERIVAMTVDMNAVTATTTAMVALIVTPAVTIASDMPHAVATRDVVLGMTGEIAMTVLIAMGHELLVTRLRRDMVNPAPELIPVSPTLVRLNLLAVGAG